MQSLTRLFTKSIRLIVIRNPINTTPDDIDVHDGSNIIELLQEAFKAPRLPKCVRLYHGGLTPDCDVTPHSNADVDRLTSLDGKIYAVVVPMGLDPVSWIIVGVSVLVSVAAALLMPMPTIPNANGGSAAPSPNNALANRTNRQRLGARIPDIFGTVYAIPDLLAPTYSVYINHKEVEMSYFCVGRGRLDVKAALDDTTPINQVFGSSVLIFDPDTTIDDAPAYQFGNAMTADEAAWSRMAAKRYNSVNGQVLQAPDSYLQTPMVFRAPNIIEGTGSSNFNSNFKAGDTILIEGADNLESANGITVSAEPDAEIVKYTLNGQYTVESVDDKILTLSSPAAISPDWQTLTDNTDATLTSESVTLSSEADTLWQGWYYTDLKEHDSAYINIIANGLYDGEPSGRWRGLRLFGAIESEIVDSSNNPIAGTLAAQEFTIQSPNTENMTFRPLKNGYQDTANDSLDNRIRSTAAITVEINNPNFSKGKRLRIRVSRTSNVVRDKSGGIVDEIKLKDFYGVHRITASEQPSGVTTAISKTLGTEGALSLKERKLRLLVQRYVKAANTGVETLSNKADDIIYHIATDAKIGNLSPSQLNTDQIVGEMNLLRAYFVNNKYGEFCYTFDDSNISSEETLQTVAQCVYSQLYRFNNKLQLHFERPQPIGVAVFNSHNILPDSYEHSESFGITKDFDSVTVKYTDPIDDAQVTVHVPNDYEGFNADEHTLVGVRNKAQALAHAWRVWNKHVYSYKSIEFTGADESNIVVRSQRIDVADQYRANVMQGVVTDLQTDSSNRIVMTLSEPIAASVAGNTHTLFIQLINGQVDTLKVDKLNDYQVQLPRLPLHTISTSLDNVVQSTYHLVENRNSKRDAYLVSAKDPNEGMTNTLSAINYDANYYKNDLTGGA